MQRYSIRLLFVTFVTIQPCCSTSLHQIFTLVREFDIRHPMIIADTIKTGTNYKILKNIFKKNERACINTWFPNITGSGIVFNANENFVKMKSNPLKKPWMIINEGEDYFPKFYSRIDEPIFTYENNSVWEFYQLKEFLGENQLGTFGNHNFSWNPSSKHPKNLYERRGNFHGVTLFGLNAPEGCVTFSTHTFSTWAFLTRSQLLLVSQTKAVILAVAIFMI